MSGRQIQSLPEVSSEDVAHVLDGTCWCQPVVDWEDPISGDRVYVHRRTMDGPAYERDDDGSSPEHREGE